MFYLISKSKLTFTPEGIITHVSAAFDIPCISIYTGYHYSEISKYKETIPILPHPLPKCAYCFKKVCPISKDKNVGLCEKNISLKEMISKINFKQK